MEPKLVPQSGTLEGGAYVLPEGEVSIGRDPSNQIVVNDPSVSRRHCRLSRMAGRVTITDLGSLNGTTLNGLPVDEKELTNGDQVGVGDVHFLFLFNEGGEEMILKAVQLEREDLPAHSTVRLRKEGALYLTPEELPESLPASERIARDFGILLKISASINSIRGLNALQQRLLQLIFEVMPAERGAIVLTGASPDEFVSLIGLDRNALGDRKIRVSHTILNQVMREGAALLVKDIVANSELSKVQSLRVARTSSLLCVPLIFFGEVIGAIYLETGDETVKFDDGNLELMTGIASVAAVALENALQFEWLESENQRLLETSQIKHQMIGNSPPMRKLYRLIGQIAPTESTVLIRGESGTGKELAAQAIHLNSLRADNPFIPVNCAALPESLFENEFFGHEREAYSGAASRRKGLLEAADSGTIFLDEVAELTPGAQAKLLRVVEEQKFRRVGGTEAIEVDVRLIAATNRNLEEAVKKSTFREDLFHRLNVISLEMPPLRERGDDILLLASYFLKKHSQKHKRNIVGITREARMRLVNNTWLGNVRELKNSIERAVVMSSGDLLTADLLPGDALAEHATEEGAALNMHEAVKEAQRRVILKTFKQAGFNYTETAKIIGVHPNHLHRMIRTLNLKSALIQLTSRMGSI